MRRASRLTLGCVTRSSWLPWGQQKGHVNSNQFHAWRIVNEHHSTTDISHEQQQEEQKGEEQQEEFQENETTQVEKKRKKKNKNRKRWHPEDRESLSTMSLVNIMNAWARKPMPDWSKAIAMTNLLQLKLQHQHHLMILQHAVQCGLFSAIQYSLVLSALRFPETTWEASVQQILQYVEEKEKRAIVFYALVEMLKIPKSNDVVQRFYNWVVSYSPLSATEFVMAIKLAAKYDFPLLERLLQDSSLVSFSAQNYEELIVEFVRFGHLPIAISLWKVLTTRGYQLRAKAYSVILPELTYREQNFFCDLMQHFSKIQFTTDNLTVLYHIIRLCTVTTILDADFYFQQYIAEHTSKDFEMTEQVMVFMNSIYHRSRVPLRCHLVLHSQLENRLTKAEWLSRVIQSLSFAQTTEVITQTCEEYLQIKADVSHYLQWLEKASMLSGLRLVEQTYEHRRIALNAEFYRKLLQRYSELRFYLHSVRVFDFIHNSHVLEVGPHELLALVSVAKEVGDWKIIDRLFDHYQQIEQKANHLPECIAIFAKYSQRFHKWFVDKMIQNYETVSQEYIETVRKGASFALKKQIDEVIRNMPNI